MKNNLSKIVCSVVVLCLALNLTPVVAMSALQSIPIPIKILTPVDLAPEFSTNTMGDLRKLEFRPGEGMEHLPLIEPERLGMVAEGVGEREYIPPKPEDLAMTANQVRTFSCSTVIDVPQVECEALVTLYGSTNGAGWYDRSSWLSSATVDNWWGINASAGHVTSIDLATNNLIGSIPTGLGVLTSLSYLNLARNQLSGTIPADLGLLTSLTTLSLYYNNLSGSIPSQLGNLVSMEMLSLDNNQLSGNIPPELGFLINMRYFMLNDNQLSGIIPPAFGDLSSLQALNLNNNQLSGIIPPQLGVLSSLMYLTLDHNQLSGTIPEALGNCSFMDQIYLNNNQLNGSIPPELGSLTRLRKLFLNNNQLSGSIPSTLGSLTRLDHLDLSQNMFSGDVPASFTSLELLCTPDYYSDPCYSTYGLDLGYNHLNVPAPQPPADFLDIRDPDWYKTQAVTQVINGESGGSLISYDGGTQVDVPADAVTGEVTFLFDPQAEPTQVTGVLSFAGNSFELTAQDGESNPVTEFSQPLVVTITYDEASLGKISEVFLRLYFWDEDTSVWADVASSCPGGEYTRDLAANWLSVPLCHLSEFALLGAEWPFFTYLPLIIR